MGANISFSPRLPPCQQVEALAAIVSQLARSQRRAGESRLREQPLRAREQRTRQQRGLWAEITQTGNSRP